MRRIAYLLLFSITIATQCVFCEEAGGSSQSSGDSSEGSQDSVFLRQQLYNGKVWRNIYSHRVTGNQFLFTREFLTGSVTMNGKLFTDHQLKYDTYNDELLIVFDNMTILQLNKEMINMFTLNYADITHKFIKLEADSLIPVAGYVDIVYEGKTTLYVKYTSEISRLAQGRTYDVFINDQRIYLKKGDTLFNIRKEKDLLNLLGDKQQQIRHYIRVNKIRLSKKVPESFVPVLKYYDDILQ